MVVEEEQPNFPKYKCLSCGEVTEVIRHWTSVPGLGDQLIIDWVATERRAQLHDGEHIADLINGAEDLLRADARRRGA